MKIRLILLLALASLTACKSEERKAAESLLARAQSLIQNGEYTRAIEIIDSLNATYPKEVEARKQSTPLRIQALKEYSEQQYAMTDSLIDALEPQLAAYEAQFRHVGSGDPDIPGYFIAKAVYNPDFASSTSMEARVNDMDYSLYLVAVNSGKPIGIGQVILTTDDGESMSTAELAFDNPRRGDTDPYGSDLATFTYKEAADLAKWVAENAPRMKYATFVGADGQTSVKFSPAQAKALADTYQFSDVAFKLHAAKVLNQKLEKQLVTARDHEVNLD